MERICQSLELLRNKISDKKDYGGILVIENFIISIRKGEKPEDTEELKILLDIIEEYETENK